MTVARALQTWRGGLEVTAWIAPEQRYECVVHTMVQRDGTGGSEQEYI